MSISCGYRVKTISILEEEWWWCRRWCQPGWWWESSHCINMLLIIEHSHYLFLAVFLVMRCIICHVWVSS